MRRGERRPPGGQDHTEFLTVEHVAWDRCHTTASVCAQESHRPIPGAGRIVAPPELRPFDSGRAAPGLPCFSSCPGPRTVPLLFDGRDGLGTGSVTADVERRRLDTREGSLVAVLLTDRVDPAVVTITFLGRAGR